MHFQHETPRRITCYSLRNEVNMKKPKHRWATERKKKKQTKSFSVTFISCGDGESQFLSHLKHAAFKRSTEC